MKRYGWLIVAAVVIAILVIKSKKASAQPLETGRDRPVTVARTHDEG